MVAGPRNQPSSTTQARVFLSLGRSLPALPTAGRRRQGSNPAPATNLLKYASPLAFKILPLGGKSTAQSGFFEKRRPGRV